jgi:hypothetical protein
VDRRELKMTTQLIVTVGLFIISVLLWRMVWQQRKADKQNTEHKT